MVFPTWCATPLRCRGLCAPTCSRFPFGFAVTASALALSCLLALAIRPPPDPLIRLHSNYMAVNENRLSFLMAPSAVISDGASASFSITGYVCESELAYNMCPPGHACNFTTAVRDCVCGTVCTYRSRAGGIWGLRSHGAG